MAMALPSASSRSLILAGSPVSLTSGSLLAIGAPQLEIRVHALLEIHHRLRERIDRRLLRGYGEDGRSSRRQADA